MLKLFSRLSVLVLSLVVLTACAKTIALQSVIIKNAPTEAAYGAEVVSFDIPSKVSVGKKYTASITLKNTGASSWTKAELYRLGVVGDLNPFGEIRADLPENYEVKTNESYKFEFSFVGPKEPGSYAVEFRLVKELVAWIGDSLKITSVAK